VALRLQVEAALHPCYPTHLLLHAMAAVDTRLHCLEPACKRVFDSKTSLEDHGRAAHQHPRHRVTSCDRCDPPAQAALWGRGLWIHLRREVQPPEAQEEVPRPLTRRRALERFIREILASSSCMYI
jgi:hypothetical protein